MNFANCLVMTPVASEILNKEMLANAFHQLVTEDRLVSLDDSGDFNHKDLMAVTIDEVGLGVAMVIDDELYIVREAVNDGLEILTETDCWNDASRRAIEDGITSAIAHGTAATTAEMNEAFTALFDSLPRGEWNNEWHNGTGWLNGLTEVSLTKPTAYVDEHDRRVVAIPFRSGRNMVVFDRYEGRHDFLVGHLPRTIAYCGDASGRLTTVSGASCRNALTYALRAAVE